MNEQVRTFINWFLPFALGCFMIWLYWRAWKREETHQAFESHMHNRIRELEQARERAACLQHAFVELCEILALRDFEPEMAKRTQEHYFAKLARVCERQKGERREARDRGGKYGIEEVDG